MIRLPRVTARVVIRALNDEGFRLVRQRGSHAILKHPDGRMTVVPAHRSETIGPGLLAKIIREAEISPEHFIELLGH